MSERLFAKIVTFSMIAIAIVWVFANSGQSNIAFAEPKGVNLEEFEEELNEEFEEAEVYQVQAVLTAQRSAVISGAMDGVLRKLPFNNGDLFKKGDVLVSYNCRFEQAKFKEILAQLKIASRQAEAYERLKELDAVAEIEYVSILQDFEKAKAVLEQTKSRLSLCTIKAPFDGRVTDKTANKYEAVKSGRVLMEISSNDPLQVELLVPSVWLRWLNIGTGLRISIHETGRTYDAQIKRIHGKVDPVTQTAYVVAEISQYEEELLPGMSGQAIFDETFKKGAPGFLGIKISDDE